jgi:hypothetical protein
MELAGLENLQLLGLNNTKVTFEAIAALRDKLPRLEVRR